MSLSSSDNESSYYSTEVTVDEALFTFSRLTSKYNNGTTSTRAMLVPNMPKRYFIIAANQDSLQERDLVFSRNHINVAQDSLHPCRSRSKQRSTSKASYKVIANAVHFQNVHDSTLNIVWIEEVMIQKRSQVQVVKCVNCWITYGKSKLFIRRGGELALSPTFTRLRCVQPSRPQPQLILPRKPQRASPHQIWQKSQTYFLYAAEVVVEVEGEAAPQAQMSRASRGFPVKTKRFATPTTTLRPQESA